MDRLVNAINRAVNNNTVIDVFLVGCFAALAVRSANHQEEIQALETDKGNLIKYNKDIKNTIWKSKQHLFAAAAAEPESASAFVPPLATLKAIYGEAIIAPSPPVSSSLHAMNQGEVKSTASKIII